MAEVYEPPITNSPLNSLIYKYGARRISAACGLRVTWYLIPSGVQGPCDFVHMAPVFLPYFLSQSYIPIKTCSHSTVCSEEVCMSTRLLRRPQVEAQTSLSRSSIYAQMAKGEFPRPLRIGMPRTLRPYADPPSGENRTPGNHYTAWRSGKDKPMAEQSSQAPLAVRQGQATSGGKPSRSPHKRSKQLGRRPRRRMSA